MKSTRREFLKVSGLATAGACLAGPACVGTGPGKRPNVLFMAIDDLNDWVGCLGGHPGAKTPNIDRLAARGVLFTNTYCAAPACNPSRAALMTGIRPSTSGVYENPQPWRGSDVLKEAATLPQSFMAGGYTALGSGKIYHGRYPDPPSWHEYWPSQGNNSPRDPKPGNRPLNGMPNVKHFDWGPIDVPAEQMGDWQVADWVIDRLSRRHEQPFFLACGFYRPHLPWYVPRKYFDMHPLDGIVLPNVKEDDLDDVPESARKMARPDGDHKKVVAHDQWRRAVQGYLASTSFADDCVGRVVDAYDRSPARNNTIIVLWSDHGWHLGEKLHWRKFALWEEATRNPMLWIVPGLTEPGGRCARPVSLLDIYPTLLDVCGLEPRAELEGQSLRPWLADPGAPKRRPALTTYRRGNHSVRSARWRYTRYKDGGEELYDHDVDQMEWRNLAGDPQYTSVKAELQRWIPAQDAPDAPRRRKKR